MSIEFVGFENLPNAYIKDIMIYDHDQNNNEIKVTVRVHDLADGSIWFDTSEKLQQLLRISLIFSTDDDQIEDLTNGRISPVSVQDKMTRSVPFEQKTEDNLVFEVSFSKIIKKSTSNLSLYSFCFVDKAQVLEIFGFPISQSYYGPMKSENVFRDQNIVTNTNVFTRENGDYWSGPVHSHQGKFMIGSYHTETPHENLTRTIVSNTKIKDFRNLQGKKGGLTFGQETFISDLSVSYNSDTDINAMFMLNVKTLLRDNTKYGSFLNRATRDIVSTILNDFKINILTLQRIRIQGYDQSLRLRTRKRTAQKVFSRKNIVKSFDINGSLRNMTRLERNGSFDVVESELPATPPTGVVLRNRTQILKEDVANFKKISMISELFFDYGQEIRAFQFNDYEMTSGTRGEYQYKMELQFTDPIYKFLSELISSMKQDLSTINSYVGYVSRNRDLALAGINTRSLVDSFVKYYSYVYEISDLTKQSISFKYLNMLAQKSVSISSAKEFQREYYNLYTVFLRFLDQNPERLIHNKERVSISAKNQTTNTIRIEKTFDKIVIPSSNEVGFAYMNGESRPSMKVYSKRELEDLTSEEIDKHYQGPPSVDSPDLPSGVGSGLSNISSSRSRHWSPKDLFKGRKRTRMRGNSRSSHEEVNNSLGARAPQQSPFGIRKTGIRTNQGTTGAWKIKTNRSSAISNAGITVSKPKTKKKEDNPEFEETNETYIESSKIIGAGQEFVTYSEVSDSYNVSSEITGVNEKFDNTFTGFQNNRTFVATLAAAKDLTPQEASELPLQLKAVIAGETDATKTNYITAEEDLLANPKTKNYYELNNFQVQQLIYIDGFEHDKNDNILLNKPIYKSMSLENFQLTTKPVLCFLEAYTNNKFKITDEGSVSVIDSVFIMSDRDISEKPPELTTVTETLYEDPITSYQFLNSNVVVQSNYPVTIDIQQTTEAPATAATPVGTAPAETGTTPAPLGVSVSSGTSTSGTY
tara:strand:- start:6720 stop:9665 length:2946 start_codon:yes stop_codon:yes gene_type:complete